MKSRILEERIKASGKLISELRVEYPDYRFKLEIDVDKEKISVLCFEPRLDAALNASIMEVN